MDQEHHLPTKHHDVHANLTDKLFNKYWQKNVMCYNGVLQEYRLNDMWSLVEKIVKLQHKLDQLIETSKEVEE